MPDTLKQFYNASINVTGLTGNQTATLFTNNATTRAVIKDIDVANTFPVAPNLTVAGTTVASLGSNLTGSEIVDVSQAVQISFPAALIYTASTLVYLNPGVQRTSIIYNISGFQSSNVILDQAVPSQDGAATHSPALYYATDGDVFSVQTNGDSSWFLFKNAGSASGTRTTINTGNTANYSAIAFDGVNTFYWLSSTTNLRAFNADTETTTNTAIAATTAAAQWPRIVHSNGYLLYAHANGNYPYLIEISTGRWVQCIGVADDWDQASSIPGFWFETSTRVATLMFFNGAGPNVYYRYISPAIPVLTAASSSFSSTWSSGTLAAGSFQGSAAATSSTHIVLSSADGGIMLQGTIYPATLSGISGATSGWRLSAGLNATNGAFWRPRAYNNLSPTVNTINFPSTISLRVTGVEVTP
jgi:hypothetical protein